MLLERDRRYLALNLTSVAPGTALPTWVASSLGASTAALPPSAEVSSGAATVTTVQRLVPIPESVEPTPLPTQLEGGPRGVAPVAAPDLAAPSSALPTSAGQPAAASSATLELDSERIRSAGRLRDLGSESFRSGNVARASEL